MQLAQPAPQGLAHLGIERTKGLVEQQHPGFNRQRPGQGDALALAARQLVRKAVRHVAELHPLQQGCHTGLDLALGRAAGAGPHPQAEGHVLEHAHLRKQRVVLEDKAHLPIPHIGVGGVKAVQQHRACIGHVQPGDDAQQRGLARARWPEQRHQLTVGDVQVQVVADHGGAKALAQVADFDAHAGFLSSPASRFWACKRCSSPYCRPSVTSASAASSEATAKAAANWYSL